jgi:hypothetical protein
MPAVGRRPGVHSRQPPPFVRPQRAHWPPAVATVRAHAKHETLPREATWKSTPARSRGHWQPPLFCISLARLLLSLAAAAALVRIGLRRRAPGWRRAQSRQQQQLRLQPWWHAVCTRHALTTPPPVPYARCVSMLCVDACAESHEPSVICTHAGREARTEGRSNALSACDLGTLGGHVPSLPCVTVARVAPRAPPHSSHAAVRLRRTLMTCMRGTRFQYASKRGDVCRR